MGALITIIVPAYNVEKYIQECLNSLVHQTMINHKIVIVNDGQQMELKKFAKNLKKNTKN